MVAVGAATGGAALGIWSAEAEVRTGSSTPPEAAARLQVSRVGAGAETLSDAVACGAVGAEGAMETGADAVETGGEVTDRLWYGGEDIPEKDSRLWDPSLSTAVERKKSHVNIVQ